MTRPDATCLRRRLLSSLYVDAMVLADDLRAVAEHRLAIDADAGRDPVDRVLASCEQLRMTTRLMSVLSWLLIWRSIDAGETVMEATPRLEPLPRSDIGTTASLPDDLRVLSEDGMALYRRAAFLDAAIADGAMGSASPARAIQHRLAAAI
jgi:regulator of CtrA degradation